ncbi:hypothetical protein PAT3040_01484 [Paenibacillus agaridevorans]|uniref:SLH domain-containing protein n=1 Tax=Paenibacillus agaridevorans TaxID=171404 RepID=A0A2R5EJZ9_9BACL|nr:metallophosphoesterase [Paenibacillus agaridevorans]GBG06942.1 hypothetical protein PAT3040_01484 [Paenibacillus agaridevorans]
MNQVKKAMSKITIVILAVLITISGIVTPNTASAAAPAGVPSQMTMGLAGGAEPGKSAMSFNWVTDPKVTDSEIVYGTSPTLTDGVSVSATMSTPKEEDIIISNTKRPNEFTPINSFNVVIRDLTPEQEYFYKVGNETDGYSAVASFTAAADPAKNKPFSFVVTPDTQGYDVKSYENTAKMFDHIKEKEADAAFLLHTGDIVEDGNSSYEWQYFFDAAQNLLDTMPIVATPGNHDGYAYDRDFIQYKARFDYSSLKKPDGLSEASQGTVYSFEYGDALFISLNSYAVTSEDRKIQWDFLAEEANNTSKAWKIVYFHAPPYDPGASHYALDNVTGKKLTDAGIDLVLHGHEHAYARSTLKTTSTDPGKGSIENVPFGEAPTYVIGGSVYNYAYSLNATEDTSWNDFFYDLRINKSSSGGGSIHSPGVYSKVEVSSNAITYKAYYKALGEDKPFYVIDEFNIVKSGEKITQPTGGDEAPTSVTYMYDNFNEQTRKSEKDEYIARFNWVTPVTTTSSQLFYAKKSDFEKNGKFTNLVLGTNFTVDLRSNVENLNYTGAGVEYSVEPVQSHKAETAVLEPDTEYVYSVGDGFQNVTSVTNPASFKTPASNLDTFNFNWISDAQANDTRGYEATLNSYMNMSKKALTQAFTDFPDASFVLSSGDQVNFGFDTWEWDAFFEANQELFSKVPLYMATGNHEFDGAGNKWANNSWAPVDPALQNFLGRHNPPKNGVSFYGGGNGTERMVSGMTKLQHESSNYYFIYGDTLFLVMDYQDQSSKEQIKAQQDWMKSVVKQNPTKWRVGMFHKTLFGYRMPTPVASWTDAFDEAGIDIVLMGHDHIYARTKLFASGQVVLDYGDGTTYLTNYSANKDNRGAMYKQDPGNPAIAYIDVREVGRGYANISISPDEIRVTSKGFDKEDILQTGDSDVLVTNKPRTYDLEGWKYPAVPQEVNEFTVTNISLTGVAKEGQNLHASITPSSATASIQWERSTNGTTWTPIEGATSSQYKIKDTDVDSFLRAVATGTGFYNGVAASAATAKVTGLGGNTAEAIKIGTADELVALSKGFGTPNYPVDGRYVLSADIDMSGVEFSAIGGGTAPISFVGTFEGNGHTIRNLTIESSGSLVGFFSYIGTGGKVINLKLDHVDITGGNHTGAIAGLSTGTIENSTVNGKVTGKSNTGGIVGVLHGGTLQNSAVTATVYGDPAGGLIGGTNYVAPLTKKDEVTGNIILNNYVAGTVSGPAGGGYIGAIVGDMGGSSGSLLQTFHGNAVTNEVIGANPGKFAGYWSSGRPIIDKNQVNYYDSGKLSTSGIPAAATIGKSASDFVLQATYEALGWDFENIWEWDETNHVPLLRAIPAEVEVGIVQIGTASELAALSAGFGTTAYPIDGNYELTAHIDMSGVDFSAIGGGDHPTSFIGTFDGKGYTISNLTIEGDENNTGFFSYIGTGGKVINLKLNHVNIKGNNNTGAIAGTSMGTIENSSVDGEVRGGSYTGGVVGLLHAGTLQNSAVTAAVYGKTVGGLIGGSNWNSSDSPIIAKDSTTGKVIVNNYVAGAVYGLGSYEAALIGDMGGSSGSLLQTLHGNVLVNDVYDATGAENVKSENIGAYWSGSRPIIDSDPINYFDNGKLSTTGLPSGIVPAFVGKSASDLTQQAAFEGLGWNFTNIWEWDEVKNIPVLRGMPIDEEVVASALTVTGATILVDGNVTDNRSQIEENKQVTVTAVVPSGKRFVKWTAEGLENESYTANPLLFTMPANEVTLTAIYEDIPGSGGNGGDGGDGSGNGNPGTVTPTPEAPKTQENIITVTAEFVQTSAGRTAVAALTEQAVEDAVAFAKTANGAKNTVEIKVEAPAGAKAVEVAIPQKSMTAVADAQLAGLTIATAVASITFDVTAVKAIAEAAKADIKVSVSAVDPSTLSVSATTKAQLMGRPVFDFTVMSGDEKISSFNGGNASIVVPYTLKSGENADAIVVYYLDESGNLENVLGRYDAATGTVKMTLRHFSNYVIAYNNKKFADVLSTSWYASAVQFVAARQLFNGVAEGEFAPNKAMTRAMFATVLANMENADLTSYKTSEFTDVDINAWYGSVIAWAADKNIVSGVGNSKFDPNASITREQMAVMLHNYIEYKGITLESTSPPAFADASTVSVWAKDAVAKIQSYGLISGVGNNTFAPSANANRASVATIFTNLIKALIK